ncbi:uncharacterized protein EV422DRAFT_36293, partial [Fimicolochytrium jonesii]|uniref:uncharacterized protein n=1 Tax=Fimicolochytrium jonesii TaxID=1396493 RepID=UPI0022FF37F6
SGLNTRSPLYPIHRHSHSRSPLINHPFFTFSYSFESLQQPRRTPFRAAPGHSSYRRELPRHRRKEVKEGARTSFFGKLYQCRCQRCARLLVGHSPRVSYIPRPPTPHTINRRISHLRKGTAMDDTSPPSAPTPHHRGTHSSHTASLAKLAVHVLIHLFPATAKTTNLPRLTHSLHTILSRTLIKPTTVFLALQYLAGLAHANPRHTHAVTHVMASTPLAPLVLLTAAISTADSFLNDIPHSISHYSYVSGLSTALLVAMKKAICEGLQWQLVVPSEVFGRWVAWLRDFAGFQIRRVESGQRMLRQTRLGKWGMGQRGRVEARIRQTLRARLVANGVVACAV